MYAVVRIKNTQYKVAPGDRIQVPLLDAEAGSTITLDEVLAVSNGSGLLLGAPLVEGATVEAQVLRHDRGNKIRVFTYKRRKGYEKRRGHRQDFTELKVAGVTLNGQALA